MSSAGRNDPCPCGSGLKYKKCCLASELSGKTKTLRSKIQVAKTESAVIERLFPFDQRKPVSPDVGRIVREILGDTPIKNGTIEDFLVYIEPMIEADASNRESLEQTVVLGGVYWILSQVPAPDFDQSFESLTIRLNYTDEEKKRVLKQIGREMRKRHGFLFPHLHRGEAEEESR